MQQLLKWSLRGVAVIVALVVLFVLSIAIILNPESRTRYGEAQVRHILLERIEGLVNSDPADQGFCHDEQAAWDALARLECRLNQEQ